MAWARTAGSGEERLGVSQSSLMSTGMFTMRDFVAVELALQRGGVGVAEMRGDDLQIVDIVPVGNHFGEIQEADFPVLELRVKGPGGDTEAV